MSTYPDHTGSGGDTELLAAVAEGDPEAFGTLYDRHTSWLMLRLRRRTADLDLVDQIVQDTFLVVWRDAGRFRGSGACSAGGGRRTRQAPRSRPSPRSSTAT